MLKTLINEEVYLNLSNRVYDVDSAKNNVIHPKVADVIYNGQFQVLKVEDNVANGMQAMAVAPVVDGKADTSQIVIAYAGTNIWDGGKDVPTDMQMIGLGNTDSLVVEKYEKTYVIVDSQAKTALSFAKSIQQKYRNSKITTSGHSLGEALAMYVALKNNWNNVGFNGPDIANMISKKELEYMLSNPQQFINFRNWYDYIGGITGNTTNSAVHLDYGWRPYTHGIDDWKHNNKGQLTYGDGEVVIPLSSEAVDINADGTIDMHINGLDSHPRDLLTSEEYITSSQAILVNPELLTVLANNLRTRLSEDIGQVNKLCRLCIEKNQSIDTNFEARKQKISESIQELFKSAGFPSLLYDVRNSVEVIMNQKTTLERCRDTYAELAYPFSSSQTPLIDGHEWNPFFYNTQLATLRQACMPLVTQIHQEKTHTFTSFFLGEQTLLGSWQQIDHATKQLLEESDRLFEGEGLRLGKKDGITDALTAVLATIEKNTTELAQSLESVVELIEGISTHFKQADEWLGTQLQQGHFVGTLPSPTVPQNYQAYLERDEIFDDVKDVLQAFDKQVEQNSRQYARKVAQVYSDVMGNFEQGLERWHTLSVDLRQAIVAITENYDVSVHVKEEVMVEKKVGEQLIQETSYPVHYWGRLERLYPGEVTEMIRQLKSRLLPKIESIQQAIWKSNRVKNQLQYMESPLKPIVEEGVYQAFDLDEIIKGQQQVIQLIQRLEQEIGHVAQVITGEGMAAKSIETLQYKLFDTQRLLKYYTRFVSDCFGDNEYSGMNNTIPTSASKFSLNTTMF